MMGVDTIYIITSGSYSDYSIDMATTDKDMAEKWLRHLNKKREYDAYTIEEFPNMIYENPPTLKKFWVASFDLYIEARPPIEGLPNRVYWFENKDKDYGIRYFDGQDDNRDYTTDISTYVLDCVQQLQYTPIGSAFRGGPNKKSFIITASSTRGKSVAKKALQDLMAKTIQMVESFGYKPKLEAE